jgi:undecaprenyl-diphosphatase
MSLSDGAQAPAGQGAPSRVRALRANLAAFAALILRKPRPRPAAVFAWRSPALRVAVGAIMATVALMVIMIVADSAAITQAKRLPAWLVEGFNELTDFGKAGWFLWPVGLPLAAIALLATPALPRITRLVATAMAVRLAFLFLAVGLPGLAVSIAKRIVGRARPLVEGSLDPFLFRWLRWLPEYASLPSGHATNVAAAAVAFGLIWPRARPLLWAFAIAIFASRVVIAAHYPSDVLGGAIAGVVGAWLVRDWFAARGLGFVPDGEGGVRTLAGPSFRRIKRVARQLAGQ